MKTIETSILWQFFAVDLAHIWTTIVEGALGSKTEKADDQLVYNVIDELRDRMTTFLMSLFPGIPINEEGVSQWPPKEDFCSIDLVDGTQSLLLGTPLFGVQFAVVVNGIIEEAVIFLPSEQRLSGGGLHIAKRNMGAFLVLHGNTTIPLHVSTVRELSKATIAFDGTTHAVAMLYRHPLTSAVPRIRNLSAFCWAGTRLVRGTHLPVSIDAVIGINNKPWDHIPSIALVEEAGGIVTDFQGDPHSLMDCRDLVFSNAYLHEQILQHLQVAPVSYRREE